MEKTNVAVYIDYKNIHREESNRKHNSLKDTISEWCLFALLDWCKFGATFYKTLYTFCNDIQI